MYTTNFKPHATVDLFPNGALLSAQFSVWFTDCL